MLPTSFDELPYEPGATSAEGWPDPARLRALEKIVANLALGDLPMAELKDSLETSWSPDSSTLFPSGSISYESLPFRLTYGQLVGATGAVALAGTGNWTAVRNAVGNYTISFPAYRTVPIALPVPATSAVAGLYVAGTSVSTAQFIAAADNDLNFLVVGR